MHKVSVIIPNYNGKDILKKNLPSLLKAKNYPKNRISEIILVDDSSKDESVDYVKDNYPEVKVVVHKVNRGFSSAVNTGARTAKGFLLALINNDVLVSENFLESVHKHFKDESVFAVSLNEQGYSWATAEFKNGYIRHQPGKETDKVHRTFWVSGGSGVFRRDYWMSLGGMDETLYKFYWEDMDLCYRAAKRGYNLLWDPDARVVHKHESSTSTSFTKRGLSDMQETNELLFHWKNITSNNLFRKHIAGMFRRAVRNPGYARIILRALMRFWKVRRARLKEKKECKVSDEAILSRFR